MLEQYKKRRVLMREAVYRQYKKMIPIIFAAHFEGNTEIFHQESTFFYFSGIQEPASLLVLFPDGRDVLYVPSYQGTRLKWVGNEVIPGQEVQYGVDEIRLLSEQPLKHYSFPFGKNIFLYEAFSSFLSEWKECFALQKPFPYSPDPCAQLLSFLSYGGQVITIENEVAQLRRTKDEYERAALEKAIAITGDAFVKARALIKEGQHEYNVQAAFEASCKHQGASFLAYPSIIASGVNATVLHYTQNNRRIQKGEGVLIDAGCRWEGYCADISRTYFSSDSYSQRYKDLYEIVSEVKARLVASVKPGMSIIHPHKPEQSLHHRAIALFDKKGLASFFTHSIGHHLGLDCHEPVSPVLPLQPGDVITIEPGLYIPDEGIGIRIEDNYYVTEEGVECLSGFIPYQ